MKGENRGRKGQWTQLIPTARGPPQEDGSQEAVLCSTEQLGGKREVSTKMQITLTLSQPCEWI